MKRIGKKIILFSLAFFFIHEVIIVADGLIDDEIPKANVAIILGSKVNEDGSLSKRLKARLDRGLQLYTDSVVSEIYVSGGLGTEGHYEGTVMAEYLISKGVPADKVKVDNEGVNTRSTAVNFVRDYPSESSATVVTQYFHITRTKLSFRQVGVKNVAGVHCEHSEVRDPFSAFREFFGFYKYLIYY